MKKIVSLIPLGEDLIEKIKARTKGFELVVYPHKDYRSEDLADAEIILGWSSKVKEALNIEDNQIKWIQIWYAGVDRMPLEFLEQKNVLLTNASGANAPSIAQQVMGMLLCDVRSLDENLLNQRESNWDIPKRLTEVTGKNMLILGTGNIAKAICKYATAFDMNIYGVNRTDRQVDGFKEVYDFNRLKKVLQNFDYVVNTLPLTDETEGMVGKTVFDSMRKDAYYVSVGRGCTTVEGELIDALDNDKIAGAFLDVFAVEPLPAESPLWKHSKVMLSPHTSGITDYYNERIINSFLRNFECYKDGKDIEENLVDYKRQY